MHVTPDLVIYLFVDPALQSLHSVIHTSPAEKALYRNPADCSVLAGASDGMGKCLLAATSGLSAGDD